MEDFDIKNWTWKKNVKPLIDEWYELGKIHGYSEGVADMRHDYLMALVGVKEPKRKIKVRIKGESQETKVKVN